MARKAQKIPHVNFLIYPYVEIAVKQEKPTGAADRDTPMQGLQSENLKRIQRESGPGAPQRINALSVAAFLVLTLIALPRVSHAQQSDPRSLWREIPPRSEQVLGRAFLPHILRAEPPSPPRYREFKLDVPALENILNKLQAPAARPDLSVDPNFLPLDEANSAQISVPAPDGRVMVFIVGDAGVMSPGLAEKYPAIRAYRGFSMPGEPEADLRLEVTPSGVHAWVHTANGPFNVEPVRKAANYLHEDDRYATFLSVDAVKEIKPFKCAAISEAKSDGAARPAPVPEVHWGDTYRVYRLAVAATGPYTKVFGGTKAGALDAIVRTIAQVNYVYQRDLSVHLQLVGNEDQVIFTDPTNDGFSHGNANALMHQSQTTIDKLIGPANYDIGHVFGVDGAGLAQVGVVMQDGMKGQGTTGIQNPSGSSFDIDYVAHEMGHQFGAQHTFNSADSGCLRYRYASTAYEPGSGSTILGYANVCNADNLQQYTDPYFHGISLSEIHSYLSGAGDTTRRTSTGNLFPTLSAGSTKVLPISTPFKLTASLTAPPAASTGWLYAWEEFDLGPAAQLVAPDDGMIPLVRSTNSTSATRLFGVPDISNPTNVANRLPSLARSSHFRVTVRRPGATGGTVLSQTLPLQFTAAAGPFKVTSPNGTPIYAGRNSVTWDVANTSAAPVGVTQVNILLSTDGGKTFPTVLANSTANNGSAEVTLPVAATAILRVESIGNYFFADSAATPIQ